MFSCILHFDNSLYTFPYTFNPALRLVTVDTFVTCLALTAELFDHLLPWDMGPPTTSSSATPSLDVTSTYTPLFSGAPQDYKEWRKRINIYYKKMELTSRKAEAVLNLVGSLQGTAWRLVEDFNLDDAGKDNAWRDILKNLDAAFQYDSRVQLPNDFDSYFNLHTLPPMTSSTEGSASTASLCLLRCKGGTCSDEQVSARINVSLC